MSPGRVEMQKQGKNEVQYRAQRDQSENGSHLAGKSRG